MASDTKTFGGLSEIASQTLYKAGDAFFSLFSAAPDKELGNPHTAHEIHIRGADGRFYEVGSIVGATEGTAEYDIAQLVRQHGGKVEKASSVEFAAFRQQMEDDSLFNPWSAWHDQSRKAAPLPIERFHDAMAGTLECENKTFSPSICHPDYVNEALSPAAFHAELTSKGITPALSTAIHDSKLPIPNISDEERLFAEWPLAKPPVDPVTLKRIESQAAAHEIAEMEQQAIRKPNMFKRALNLLKSPFRRKVMGPGGMGGMEIITAEMIRENAAARQPPAPADIVIPAPASPVSGRPVAPATPAAATEEAAKAGSGFVSRFMQENHWLGKKGLVFAGGAVALGAIAYGAARLFGPSQESEQSR